MLCVVEEEGPDEAAQTSAALRVAKPGFVFNERLDLGSSNNGRLKGSAEYSWCHQLLQ